MLSRDPYLGGFPGDVLTPRVGVFDTDRLLNELKEQISGTAAAPARQPGLVATCRVASSHVYDEVYSADALGHANKFEKLAAQSAAMGRDTPASAFRRIFEVDRLPYIRFVDVTGVLPEHPWPQAVTHAKDVPTAQLAALLSMIEGLIVYSHDKHLRGPQLAPPDLAPIVAADWAAVMGDGMLVGGSTVGTAGVLVMNGLVARVSNAVRIPTWLGWILCFGAGAWALSNPDRRSKVGRALAPVAETLAQFYEEAEQGKKVLAEAALPTPTAVTLEMRLAKVRVFAKQPLEIHDIKSRVRQDGAELSLAALRRVLAACPAFVRARVDYWQLGEVRLPPSASAS